jgi:DNA mismatch endonuclease (patch repair protein)
VADKHTPKQRSYNMSRIRSVDTKPEIQIRHALHHLGYRYRKNDKRFPGKPDIYLPMYRTAIFIHGCFWHGHKGCKYFVIPKTRPEFWLNKIKKTKARDIEHHRQLELLGISVIEVWECEIRADFTSVIINIEKALTENQLK